MFTFLLSVFHLPFSYLFFSFLGPFVIILSFHRCDETAVVKVKLPLLSPSAEISAPEEPKVDCSDKEEELEDLTEVQLSR